MGIHASEEGSRKGVGGGRFVRAPMLAVCVSARESRLAGPASKHHGADVGQYVVVITSGLISVEKEGAYILSPGWSSV